MKYTDFINRSKLAGLLGLAAGVVLQAGCFHVSSEAMRNSPYFNPALAQPYPYYTQQSVRDCPSSSYSRCDRERDEHEERERERRRRRHRDDDDDSRSQECRDRPSYAR